MWAGLVGECLISHNRRFGHFSPNLLKTLDRGFAKSAPNPLQSIEYKGPIEMTGPKVIMIKIPLILRKAGNTSLVVALHGHV